MIRTLELYWAVKKLFIFFMRYGYVEAEYLYHSYTSRPDLGAIGLRVVHFYIFFLCLVAYNYINM